MTTARVLLWGLAAALVAGAVWAWPLLPERIPLHFGADGLPDRWGERSLWGWFVLPAIGVATAALLDGVGRWALRHPEKQTINLPSSDDLMRLPVERRIPVLRRAAVFLLGIGVWMMGGFVLFQVGSFVAAQGGASQPWTVAGLVLCLLGSPVALIWGLTAIQNEITRQRNAS